jgi:hypothetical protein
MSFFVYLLSSEFSLTIVLKFIPLEYVMKYSTEYSTDQ